MSLAFLLCVERGFLEDQAVLLCESIRRFGGHAARAPIHAFQPRAGHEVADETRERLLGLDVALHDDVRNERFPQFPRTSKVYACAWAERELDAERLVFVDSDTVFVNEPAALWAERPAPVAVRPVDSKNVCSTGPDDPREPYWQRLYAAAGVEPPGWVETGVDGQRVRACWNSGLVAVRREAGIFGQWRRDLEAILDAGVLPPIRRQPGHGIPFLDQNALAATLARRPDDVAVLPEGYNYCLPKRARMRPGLRDAGWERLVHLHYHGAFAERGALARVAPPLDPADPRHAWLDARLPLRRRERRRRFRLWGRRHASA